MKGFRNIFRSHPDRKKFSLMYNMYLNDQAKVYIKPFSLAMTVAWLWFALHLDRVLHPDYPELFYFRIGLTIAGIIVFILSFINRFTKYSSAFFLALTAYIIFSCSFFTGRLADDPNYVSGLQIIILAFVLGPFTLEMITAIYFMSIILFLLSMKLYNVHVDTYANFYSMNNLVITYAGGMLGSFIINRLRFLSYIDKIKLEEAHKKIWSEVEVAKKIQKVLLPQKPKISDFEISVYINPTEEVGGDYYDIINTAGRDWIIIGDVSGHGISAGLIMMMVQTSIKTALSSNSDMKPSELINIVNKSLMANIKLVGEERYMTITVLAYMENGKFIFSGRHEDILIYRSGTKEIENVKTEGYWLGIREDIDEMLNDSELSLDIGDVILFYTDGITESWLKESILPGNDFQPVMYGNRNLENIFHNVCLKNGSPDLIIDEMLASLDEYLVNDDVTLMVLRRIN